MGNKLKIALDKVRIARNKLRIENINYTYIYIYIYIYIYSQYGKYDKSRLWKLICIVNPFDNLLN